MATRFLKTNMTNKKTRTFVLILLGLSLFVGIFLLNSFIVYGATQGTTPVGVSGKIENPFKVGNDIYEVLVQVINNVVKPLAGVAAVLSFIWSGFLFVTAQGRPEKIKTAKNALMYTAIGTAILFGAWTIALVIESTLKQLAN